MARAFVDDRWLKNDEDGNPQQGRETVAGQCEESDESQYARQMAVRCTAKAHGGDAAEVHASRRQTRQKSRNFAKLRDAEEYAAAIEDDIRRGKYRDPQQELRIFRDVASEWTDGKMDIKQGTLGRYRRELRVYINPKWGDRTREIQRDELQQWVTQLTEGGYPAELQDDRDRSH